MASKPLNVRIPEQLQKELEGLSRREHVPVSDLVRDSLREFLAIRKFRQARKAVRGFARSAGFLTDEDVFKHIKT
jgi:Arc/MetJ-type ribon-helix-helix transcriptional regulator